MSQLSQDSSSEAISRTDLEGTFNKQMRKEYEDEEEEEFEEEEMEGEDLLEKESVEVISDDEEDMAIVNKERMPTPLTIFMMPDCLSMLCKISNGLAHAFVKLDARDLSLTSINMLSDYIYLNYIDLSINFIRDLNPVNNIKHLLTLKADNNLLTAVPMMPFNFLQRLSLANNFINRAIGFTHPSLKELILKNNRLRSMTGSKVGSMSYLNMVDLSNNKLTNLNGLESESIKILYLGYNRIDNLEGINEIPNLQTLHLRGNKLRTLDPSLFELKELKLLNLRKNRLKSFEDIADLSLVTTLKTLVLSENPLARGDLYRQEVLMRVPTLQRIDKKILDENDFKEVAELKKEREEKRREEMMTVISKDEEDEEEEEEEEEEKEEAQKGVFSANEVEDATEGSDYEEDMDEIQ